MKSSAVLNSRQERTAGSTSHVGSSKAVSGSSAILVCGSSCVATATPSLLFANSHGHGSSIAGQGCEPQQKRPLVRRVTPGRDLAKNRAVQHLSSLITPIRLVVR